MTRIALAVILGIIGAYVLWQAREYQPPCPTMGGVIKIWCNAPSSEQTPRQGPN